jgi:hypothetical protein
MTAWSRWLNATTLFSIAILALDCLAQQHEEVDDSGYREEAADLTIVSVEAEALV